MAVRVLHVIGSLGLGGAQVCMKYLVENCSEDVECFVYPLRQCREEIPIEGDILRIDYPNYDPRKFFKLIRLCREYKIDVIHAHLHKPIIAALFAGYFLKVKVVAHEHGAIAQDGLQNCLYRFVLRLFNQKADVVISPSKAIAEKLITLGKVDRKRIQVVYNAVDLSKFRPDAGVRDAMREQMGVADDDIVIGFVGRLSKVKGPDILLEAFGEALRKNSKLVLMYLGEGPMRGELTERAKKMGISEKVRFLGYREDVVDVINVFDAAAITSRQDAFPLTPLEILSMQVPLVSCTVGGLGEVVVDRVNCLVPEVNDPCCIAESLIKIVQNEGLRKRLTEEGAKTAEKFGVDKLVQAVEGIYRNF